ncbi:MAG: hypothetical protein JXR40_05245 [Pontiellaceae bacterium]|nr:hypothetical protein [Pontiellaceae bacterium]
MHRRDIIKRLIKLMTYTLLGWAAAASAQNASTLVQPSNPELPSLFIIGDSTVRNGNGTGAGGQWGWGDFLRTYFNTDELNIVNNALGGTSSRTFYRDRWPGVKAMIKPGDVVMMQFGHNDSGPINETERTSSARARGTIDGVGPEVAVVNNILTRRIETVHSYGWYLEQFIAETRALGATPIVCSLIPRNTWNDGRVARSASYAVWAKTVAEKATAPFIDLNNIIADAYDQQGQEFVNTLFVPGAGPHTSEAGAKANAAAVISGLKGLSDNPLSNYFSSAAESIPPYSMAADDDRPIVDASKLNEETTDNHVLPTLFLVGDSTVRIGGSSNEMVGWGERISPFFDSDKINVVNRAIGGRSARTFYTEGRWDNVLNELKRGDVVLIQFGHNDGGRVGDPANKHRADGPGTGPETVPDTMDDGSVVQVHTFGWHMAHYVKTAKEKGAFVVLCSPIPHKDRWQTGRDFANFAAWDQEVAEKHGALFMDLTLIVTQAYKQIGKEKADTFFADQRTHTNSEGAAFNARCVVAGLKSLPDNPLQHFFSELGQAVERYTESF